MTVRIELCKSFPSPEIKQNPNIYFPWETKDFGFTEWVSPLEAVLSSHLYFSQLNKGSNIAMYTHRFQSHTSLAISYVILS